MAGESRVTVSVVIPAFNASAELRICLNALRAGTTQPDECFVVDDGSTDNTADVAREAGCTLISTGGRMGPSFARNLGAEQATGDIVFFIDADCCPHEDTVARVAIAFLDTSVDALIGSYDADPHCPQMVSRYRNLVHHYTHQHSERHATTFWSGCGAIRRTVFLDLKGFDSSYKRPAIEDIELGYRLHAAGHSIILDREVQVKHLKRWTLHGMVKTDVMDRGIPWTLLILRAGRMPNDLNLRWHQRLSVAAVGILLLMATAAMFLHGGRFLTPAAAVLMLLIGSFWVSEAVAPDGHVIRVAMAASLLLMLVLCSTLNIYTMFSLVCFAYLFLFFREHVSVTRSELKQPLGFVYGAYLACCIVYVLFQMPTSRIILALTAMAVFITLLNFRFYAFMISRMGKISGLALIPMHMLYYFYSGLSFGLGLLINFRERGRATPGG